MKRIAFFFLCFALCGNVFAQSQYTRLEAKQANDTILYTIGKEKITILSNTDNGGLSVATISASNTLKYCSPDAGTTFSYAFFYNTKLKEGFLFMEKHLDYSRGCEVFRFNSKGLTHIGQMPVAAYTKNGKSMDYNSILPYISIVSAFNRIIMSFETPLLVLNPSTRAEEIKESNEVFYTLENGNLTIRQ
ncbi:MAG: hypothetical protein LBO06_03080 [Bacteroidales bacterium]|jgi:hypothetical protein|nr:hypothetical protein [Bacteroidales bacterium]